MTIVLRAELIILACCFLMLVLKSISSKLLSVKYALLWMLIACGMLGVAFFPGVVSHAAAFAGIETPSNFIYLLGLFSLLVIAFSLSVIVSRQSMMLRRLSQLTSIDAYLRTGQAGEGSGE